MAGGSQSPEHPPAPPSITERKNGGIRDTHPRMCVCGGEGGEAGWNDDVSNFRKPHKLQHASDLVEKTVPLCDQRFNALLNV